MSADLMTTGQRIANLVRFGYSPEESGFLCLAALHGGYFLRRQAARFLGCREGGTVAQFVSRVLALEHARTSTWRQNTQLYHLCARPLYDALGEPDNRNRRAHEWTQIKNRIMGLDFVLAHRHVRYLATEREKLDYFTETLKVDRDRLPAKLYRSTTGRAFTRRYFVDKYPMFVASASQTQAGDRVSFCFVDEGMVSLSRFESYLTLYWPLFESLPDFGLLYVAASEAHLAGARAMFGRFQGHGSAITGAGAERIDREQLLAYFRLRRRYEEREFQAFDRSELIRLRDARARFSSPEIEALYLAWRSGGDSVFDDCSGETTRGRALLQGTFSTELLTHDYGLFGNGWPR